MLFNNIKECKVCGRKAPSYSDYCSDYCESKKTMTDKDIEWEESSDPNRYELTDEDILSYWNPDWEDDWVEIQCWTNSETKSKQLKKQILEDSDKAEKIRDLYNKTLYQRNTINENIPPQSKPYDILLEWENKLKEILGSEE